MLEAESLMEWMKKVIDESEEPMWDGRFWRLHSRPLSSKALFKRLPSSCPTSYTGRQWQITRFDGSYRTFSTRYGMQKWPILLHFWGKRSRNNLWKIYMDWCVFNYSFEWMYMQISSKIINNPILTVNYNILYIICILYCWYIPKYLARCSSAEEVPKHWTYPKCWAGSDEMKQSVLGNYILF